MMITYFATFITGTQTIIASQLSSSGKIVEIIELFDGLIIFKSSLSISQLQNFRILNNVFLLLEYRRTINNSKQGIGSFMQVVATKGVFLPDIVDHFLIRNSTFRVFVSIENETVSVNRKLLEKIESHIQKKTKLRPFPSKPDIEFWFIARREGIVLFGLRLSRTKKEYRERKKGELRPELAAVLSAISEPTPDDIVLDPFCGYGSLIFERARSNQYQKIIAFDTNINLVSKTKERTRSFKNIEVLKANALANRLSDTSVTKIITDPPWVFFDKIKNPIDFYRKMLKEFRRLLTQEGLIILLMGNKEAFEKTLTLCSDYGLELEEKYDILVSRKKASIYKIRKH